MRHLLVVIVLLITAVGVRAQDKSMAAIDTETSGTVIAPSILDYGAVRDTYGGRIADRYWAIQIDIENGDERPLWIKGISVGLDPTQCDAAKALYAGFNLAGCYGLYNRIARYPASSAPTDKRILVAVAQMGQFQSKRAQIFRLVDFGMTIAPIFAPYVNTTQAATIAGAVGIGVPAFQKLFPDMSPKQIQALADQSYQPGLIVGPKQAESFILFIPSDRMFDSATWSAYTAKTQKQSPDALEMKQFLQLVVMVRDHSVYITTEPAPEARSNSLMRPR